MAEIIKKTFCDAPVSGQSAETADYRSKYRLKIRIEEKNTDSKDCVSMEENRPKVQIYTDGACSGNPGPGGYGVVLIYNATKKELSGGEANTTNNRMELMAVIEGLRALNKPCDVTLYSDSKYVVDMVEGGYLKRWKQNHWMRNKKDPVKNVDLWEQVLALLQTHTVKMIWVKGHAENPWNNRCDELAVAAAAKYR